MTDNIENFDKTAGNSWLDSAMEEEFDGGTEQDSVVETATLPPVTTSVHEAQVTDNPFSGFGRPFSNDNPMMSEQYFQDNPASATAPYSGPSSYSINTTAPWNPPSAGQENPSQNVGPYNSPGHLPVTTDADYDEDDLPANVGQGDTDPVEDARTIQAAYKQWSDSSEWYDGTPETIYNHIVVGETIRKAAAYVGEVAIEDEVSEQLDVLKKVANEISDANLEEYLEEIPGGTIALEYDDLANGGLIDTDSFLHHTAALLIKDVNETDWEAFSTEGARRWVYNKVDDNPGVLRHEAMVRKSAVDYAKDKTMVLMDPVYRAEIIDSFVTNAERFRREASNTLHKALEEQNALENHKERIRQLEAKKIVEAELKDEFFPGQYVEEGPDFIEGHLAIGPDDGTPLYEAALQSLASFDKDWPEFTTEGAREWFSERAAKNAGILTSPDLTYRASTEYARDATKFIKDASLKNEVVRAFAESVEYLRDQYENSRTASAPEHSDFDDIYADEDEILW